MTSDTETGIEDGARDGGNGVEPGIASERRTAADYRARARFAILTTLGATLALLVLWRLADVWLLVFGGVLLAVALRGLGETLAARTPLSTRPATGLVAALLVALALGGLLALGPTFADGIEQLRRSLPTAIERLGAFAAQYPWLESSLSRLRGAVDQGGSGSQLLGRLDSLVSTAIGVFSGLVGALTGLLLVAIVGLYGALSPRDYTGPFAALFPSPRVPRVRELLGALATALRWWLLGRLASMALVGVLSGIGLLALGVPSAFTLGTIAALLSFVPNIGPIAATVPAVLAGLTVSPDTALYVIALYLAVQVIESYLITPLIQQRVVALPPATVIVVQLAFGALFGMLGLLFATPIAVVAMVLVQALWVRDRLGKEVELPGGSG